MLKMFPIKLTSFDLFTIPYELGIVEQRDLLSSFKYIGLDYESSVELMLEELPRHTNTRNIKVLKRHESCFLLIAVFISE